MPLVRELLLLLVRLATKGTSFTCATTVFSKSGLLVLSDEFMVLPGLVVEVVVVPLLVSSSCD